ncbi:cupredoxin domain-containing protein, partial [Georgenia sp. 10Sc9-8]|nr:cupredoxin domain-containing protein [Georgenia halotolerans]
MNRRTWHVRANAVVLAWFLAAFVTSIVHRWVPGSGWLLTHMMLLGAVTSAILIWSGHFADTLLGRPAPGGQQFMVVRLAVHTVAAVLVMVGVGTGRWGLVVAGGAGVVAVALTHVGVLWRQRRGAVMARFGKLSLYYVAAGLMLAVGVVLGVLLARTGPDAAVQGRLYTAHVGTMLMGFVGLTVLGTLVVLWPTMLRTKMLPGAPVAAYRAMWVLLAGVALVWVTTLTGVPELALAVAVTYLAGMVLLVRPMVVIARGKVPRSFATLSAAAAVGWAAVCVVALSVLVATAESWAQVPERVGVLAAPFAAGFAGQVLLGALSYLAPVMLGGGPSVVRAVNQEMDRAAGARVVVLNACLVLFVLPLPSLVRVTSSLLGLAAMAAFLVLLGRAGWARARAARRRDDDVLSTGIRTGPPATPRRLGPVYGAAAVALAVVVGVAGDPAAAGLGTSSATADVAATGETTTVQVEAGEMGFSPDSVKVPAGDRLVLEVTNTDADVHDLVLGDGASTGRLGSGESATLDLGVVGADLEGWCSVAGHRQMGMTFDVVVTGTATGAQDGAAATVGGAAPDHGGGHGAAAGSTGGADDLVDLRATPGPGFSAHDPVLPPAPRER